MASTNAAITIIRTNGAFGAVSANYTTANGTALAGTDYTFASGSFTWPNGDFSSRTFNIAITDNFVTNSSKTVNLQITSIGGATAGITNAVLTIVDNEFGRGIVGFATNAFSVSETGGVAVITVVRTNGSLGPVGVNYTTLGSGTAIPPMQTISKPATMRRK